MLIVKDNVKDFTRWLTDVQKKQVPYATALALTRTAQDVQAYIIERIQTIFNVTKKWWLKQQPTGIKIKSATKRDLHSRIYTNAYFADLQEEGGIKRPQDNRVLAVPTDATPKSRRKSGGARIMMQQKKTFSTPAGIFRRKGRGKNSKVEKLFAYAKTATIRPRFGFKTMAKSVAARQFPKRFAESLSKALKTAK